jgi:hypothetical protein
MLIYKKSIDKMQLLFEKIKEIWKLRGKNFVVGNFEMLLKT